MQLPCSLAAREGGHPPLEGEKAMILIHREPSPAQTSANRAYSLLSTGPRSEQGKEIRNYMATSGQAAAKVPRVSTTMKAQDLKRRFSCAKVATLLKKCQLMNI